MDIISSNPYRLLGIYSNSPVKDRIANANKLKAYQKVGKSVNFPLDLLNLIPAPVRTVESIEHANGCINLPYDQLKHALFWFIKVSSIDEIALGYLQNGDTERAKKLFEKKETFSSLINLGVLALIQNDKATAIRAITKVIHNDDYRASFVEAVCGGTYQLSEDELARLFIDELLVEFSFQELMQLYLDSGVVKADNGYLKDKAVGEPIVIINAEIAKAKNVKNNDADAQYEAGIILSNKTRVPLGTIKSLLGTNDIQYQTVADNLAKQILQCGINYYNNSEEPDSAIKAMPLQEYALQIAVGTLTKDRCKKNVDILQKIVAELPPQKIWEDDKKIKQELQLFSNSGKSIMAAINLLQNCKKAILNIESKLGDNNIYFIEISNLLLEMALQEIIREVNEIQRKAPQNPILGFEYLSANEQQIFLQKRSAWIEEMKVVIPKAWTLMLLMEQFTMNKEFKEKRFLPNKSLLRDMSVSLNLHTSAFSFLNSLSSTRWLLWLIILTSLFLVYLSFQIK
ncbi:hypothetical protein [Bacteroides eggerthii]|jgi:hypothetical protein|uniref:hypothetical protein n=1 Tax=Bacteroides eggerthii TaxID=28111 RepID=UPI00321B2673